MLFTAAALLPLGLGLGEGDPPDFAARVLPILSDHCFHCHGPDAGSRQAGLRVDSAEGILDVVEPGDLDASELYARIVDKDPDWVMPPPHFGAPLEADEVETLAAWIAAGARWEEHWAFQPVKAPDVPGADSAGAGSGGPWSRDPLDALVRAELDRQGLTVSPPAELHTWLRRVTFDLTGLPPSPEDVERFDATRSRDGERAAREAAVDSLLGSRARAEHRTRQWLDVARYADTNGFQNDFRRDQWPWRDWVLRAFESNMPFDRFAVLQIAGDLVPDATVETILGTGFQRNHRTVTEAGSIDEEWRVENVADRAETTATAFLGLTLGCARCHDHKYDALTQEDYFRFYAFFDSIDEQGVYEETRGNVPPLVQVPSAEQTARLGELADNIARLRDELSEARNGVPERYAAWSAGARGPRPERPAATLAFRGAASGAPDGPRITLTGSADTAPHLGAGYTFARDEPFTTSVWVRPQSHGAIYARMAADSTYRGVDLVLLNNMRPAVHLIHSWTGDAIKVVGREPLERGTLHHVAVRYDGTSRASGVTLFVDGRPAEVDVEVDSLEGTIGTDAPLRVGTRHYAGELEGTLFDFRIYGSPLRDEDVLELARERAVKRDGVDFYAAVFDAPVRELQDALRADLRALDTLETVEIPTAMVLRDRDEPRVTRLLARGQYDKPTGDPLQPDVPAVLGGLAEGARHDRLGLAEWLVDPSQPLFARVTVNRVWASFFGEGLTPTQNDFGVRGERPVHPALLDHLAASLIESGWDLRALERRIALSATYGQSSTADAASLERDPQNRWLTRGPRSRLDAEEVRDQALFVSGLLAPRFGGPSVKPYQPSGLWAELAGGAGQGAYVPSTGDDLFRRSVYTYRKRTVPHPTLTTFDAPGFELCTVQRGRTNTPLQALATLNDPTYVEAARHLAQRMMVGGNSSAERVAAGVRALLLREPNAEESALLTVALSGHLEDFEAHPDAARELLGVGATAPPEAERTAEWAAYTMVASTLLNLDEALAPR